MPRLLLVEDDRKLALGLAELLARHGFTVAHAATGDGALTALEAPDAEHDLVILDLTLPGLDGMEVARRVRKKRATPIIMVTARGDDTDKILGLEIGADDYLVKPVNPHELVARIRAVLRRTRGPSVEERFVTGGLVIDFAAMSVSVDGRAVELTTPEFQLLGALAKNAGRVLTRAKLLALARDGREDEVFERAIDVQMSRIRSKIEADPKNPRYLKTVRGAGYALNRIDE